MTKDPLIEERQAKGRKIKNATQRILEVSAELHLTWAELEVVMTCVKRDGYISLSPGSASENAEV